MMRVFRYHQFHANTVLNRALPDSYLLDARNAAISRGWINPTCGESGDVTNGGSNVEDIRIVGCGCGFRYGNFTSFWSMFPAFLSPMPPHTRRVKCSTF